MHAGLGTPVGFIGAVLDYSPLDWLSVAGGVGLGTAWRGSSAQLAFGTRARLLPLGEGRTRIYAGLVYATGGYRAANIDPVSGLLPSHGSPSREGERVIYGEWIHWLQPSVGLEKRFESGVALRIYAGPAIMLNPGDLRCQFDGSKRACGVDAEDRDGTTVLPFIGVALGGSF